VRFDVFISYHGPDRGVVTDIAGWLRDQGVRPWFDVWRVAPGMRWQEELAAGLASSACCAVFVGPSSVGAWGQEEISVALDRSAKDRSFRIFLVLLPGVADPFDPAGLSPFVSTRTWVDLRRGAQATELTPLLEAVRGQGRDGSAPTEATLVAPYRGLRAFDEDDAGMFFGREADVQRVTEKLKVAPILAVIGASGSGKSSLVRAGLIPALHRGAIAGSETWTVRVLRPGARPLTTLAAHLVRMEPARDMGETVQRLASDPGTLYLAGALAAVDRRPDARTVWIVDQAEELFTLCRHEHERAQFVANLLYATANGDALTLAVLTLRADFYAQCAAYPQLAQAVAANQYLVSPMQPDALRRAIEAPARRSGLAFEPGLVDTILDDVSAQPGGLPLLQHALLELWNRRHGDRLSLDAYRRSGGVRGALAQRADDIYSRLALEEQEIVRQTLLRLTEPGEGTEDTRRRAPMDEVVEDDPHARAIVGQLVDARLLTTGREPGTHGEWVDVSHEALIRGWPRLRAWIDEDRSGLRIHRRVTEATQEWERLDRDDGALYRGARLVEALEWFRDDDQRLNATERAFIDASCAADHRERDREARRARRLRVLSATLFALLMATTLATFLALQNSRRAERQAQSSLSRVLAAQSLAQMDTNPERATLLALEAARADDTVEARNAVVTAAQRTSQIEATLHAPEKLALGIAVSPDGRILAVASAGAVYLWDIRTRRRLDPPLRHRGTVYDLAFSPDGRTLASGGRDQTVRLWDVRRRRASGGPLRLTEPVEEVEFSKDGRTLAAATSSGPVTLWDVGRRVTRRVTTPGDASVVGLAFQPRTGALALARLDDAVYVNLEHGPERLALHTNSVYGFGDLAFSHDGRLIAAAAGGNAVRLWNAADRSPIGPLRGHTGQVMSVAFDPSGRLLASGSRDTTVRLWDIKRRRAIGLPLRGHVAPVVALAFSPDGRTLVSASDDGKIKLWAVSGLGTPLRTASQTFRMALSSDGRLLAAGGVAVTVFDVRRRTRVRTLEATSPAPPRRLEATPPPPPLVDDVSFSDRTPLLAVAWSTHVNLWDVTKAPSTARVLPGLGQVTALAFSGDGRILATGGRDRRIRLWDPSRAVELQPPIRSPDRISSLALRRDGRVLVTGGETGSVVFWDVRRRQVLSRRWQHRFGIGDLAFSPNGRMLASGGSEGAIQLWDVDRRAPIGAPLTAHTSNVEGVAFSPDGETLASSSLDGTVRLWDVARRRPIGEPLDAPATAPANLLFSPSGEELIFANDLEIHIVPAIWRDWAPAMRRHLCLAAGRNLTRAEWQEFIPDEPYEATCP